MLTDAELAAIEARVVEFQATRAAVTGERASRDRYHSALANLDLHREDDLLALVAEVRRLLAEVRRLRTLTAAQTGAATYKARGLQSRGRAASARRPEAPTRARRLAGRPIPPAAAPLADSRS